MAKSSITQVAITDTFQDWLNKTNQIASLLNTDIMTASSGAGDVTVGNATLEGTFTSDNIVADAFSANTAGVVSLENRDTISSDISVLSPITISNTTENMLTLQSPATFKPSFRLINGADNSWELSHDNTSSSSSFIIQKEGAATPQVTISSAGKITATNFEGDGSLLTNLSIPDLAASKITSGTFGTARIPNLSTTKITSGVFDAARIPVPTNLNSTNDSSSTILYPTMVGAVGSSYQVKSSTTKLTFNASTGSLGAINFDSLSDLTTKTNINTIDNSLSKVLQMRGVYFNRKEDDDPKTYSGVIAQEIETILPEVVTTNETGLKTVSYGNIVGVLIEAIKELNDEIQTLKSNK